MDVIVTIALVLALWLPALPPLRLLLARGFRRRLALFPARRMLYVIGLSSYLALCVVVVLALPAIAPAAAALSAATFAYLYGWRARERHGARRGLPPGRLRPAPTGPWRDPYWSRARFERYGHVFKTCHVLQPMVCINHLPLARRLVKEFDSRLTTPPMPFNRYVPGGFMRYLEPGTYHQLRSTFGAVFSSSAVLDHHACAAGEIFRRHIEPRGGAGIIADPARRVEESLVDIVLLVFLGVECGIERHARFSAWLRQLDYRRVRPGGARHTLATLAAMERELEAIADPGMSYLDALRRQPLFAGHGIDRTSLWRNFIYVMITSAIDMADLVLWTWHDLAGHPEWVARLRRDEMREVEGERRQPPLRTRIVMETLRLHQSEYLMRRAREEIHIHGFTIPRNWLIRVDIREAHRDPALFEHPDRFDPDRFLAPDGANDRYAPLGVAPAPCLGRVLTLWTGEQFIRAIAARHLMSTRTNGDIELGAFHWRPSSRWQPILAPVADEGIVCSVTPTALCGAKREQNRVGYGSDRGRRQGSDAR